MPFSTYLPAHMGSATLDPPGPFVAGSYQELILTYTAGTFGIDDTGIVKISWRTTSDMGKPQFTDPAAANYTTVEASNGAKLEVWFDRLNIRPWANTILIRIGRGYLRCGDTLTVRLGDRRQGSPGYRLQTNCEEQFPLKVCIDAFAAYEFCELPQQPAIDLVPGPAHRWKAIWPSLAVAGEPFRLAIVAEDLWGNPTADADARLTLAPSRPIRGLPERVTIAPGSAPLVIENLVADSARRHRAAASRRGRRGSRPRQSAARRRRRTAAALLGRPARPERRDHRLRPRRDLPALCPRQGLRRHRRPSGQRLPDDRCVLDGAQPAHRRRSTCPAASSACPAMNGPAIPAWAATATSSTAARAGRSGARPTSWSRAQAHPARSAYTAHDIFDAMAGEDAVMIAHVGGRYADVKYAHAGKLERAVEVHSTWGTFEWLLHDALERGYRVGVVCHSDDHKGRPGATRPGASTFGAIGGITCYLMPELSRDALFAALRARRHYGTTGTRIFIDLVGKFASDVTRLSDDPQLGPAHEETVREALMGDIVRPGATPMRLEAEVIGTEPIERVDVLHGPTVVQTVRPFASSDLGRRVRVMWQGAEYRGRGREVLWKGALTLTGNKIARFAPVNFLNPERKVIETSPQALAWTSVTTGNLAGIDLWLEEPRRGTLRIDTNVVSGEVDLAALDDDIVRFDGGGLGRAVSVYRLPEADWSRRVTLAHDVTFPGGADLPVYIRVTQADGHQAWTSPIYLIA